MRRCGWSKSLYKCRCHIVSFHPSATTDAAPDAGTNAATGALSEPAVPYQPTMPHSIPIELQLRMCLHYGFWVPEKLLTNIPAIHAGLKPRASDIFLASYPKSGTTWLKALAYATLNRGTHSPFDMEHPLRRRNPHDCVGFIDMDSVFRSNVETSTVLDELEALPSPRLLATHLPYSLLPEGITTGDDEALGSNIVYICRNPKDVLVSQWFFNKKLPPTYNTEARRRTLHEEFELFCDGRSFLGPQWQHVLQYWKKSLRRPDKVLFLRYEEMLREPSRNLKKLAEFMGCAFSEEEEKGGVVDAIVELCGLSKLKSVEVNKSGSNYLAMKNEAYFRKGVVGDWSNHLTPDMAKKLDKIVEDALRGSGLDLSSSIASD